jgi:hypothetical protein
MPYSAGRLSILKPGSDHVEYDLGMRESAHQQRREATAAWVPMRLEYLGKIGDLMRGSAGTKCDGTSNVTQKSQHPC